MTHTNTLNLMRKTDKIFPGRCLSLFPIFKRQFNRKPFVIIDKKNSATIFLNIYLLRNLKHVPTYDVLRIDFVFNKLLFILHRCHNKTV